MKTRPMKIGEFPITSTTCKECGQPFNMTLFGGSFLVIGVINVVVKILDNII